MYSVFLSNHSTEKIPWDYWYFFKNDSTLPAILLKKCSFATQKESSSTSFIAKQLLDEGFFDVGKLFQKSIIKNDKQTAIQQSSIVN